MSSEASKRHCAYCLVEMDAGKAKKCGGCKKRAYCSRECQTEDWSPKKGGQGHKNWCGLDCGEEDVDWKVTPVPGKGLGIVALRDLPSKYRIIVEASVDKSHPRVADLMPEKGTADEKVSLNRLGLGTPEDGKGSVVCLRISRANHSCNPNAGHWYESKLKVKVLFAERDVKEGEEICISYVNVRDISSSETPEMGRERLKMKWGITCDDNCLCYDKEYSKKVKYGRELDANIFRLGSTGNVVEAIIQAQKLIELEEQLKLSWMNRQRTFFDGFQVAIMKRKSMKQGLEFLAKAYDILESIHHPQKTEEVQEMKMWMESPQTHWNYLLYDY